jgi:hypothetical protein
MAEQSYAITVTTPMGGMDGKVTFRIDGAALSGALTIMGAEHRFSGGTIDGDGKLSFSGELATPMGSQAYAVTGTLRDGKLTAAAKTKMGDLTIRSK